ncbi:MAG: TfoX/Sxy family protein [bacterium]|nr:TfoX/Sxy family protein [bacterium]
MAVSNSYLEYVLERMGTVGAVTARRMFGGVGIYFDITFFALIDNDTLYFKVNNENRKDYESEQMEPFRPFGEDSYSMKYYSVPERIIEDNQLLREWMLKAVAAARKKTRRSK